VICRVVNDLREDPSPSSLTSTLRAAAGGRLAWRLVGFVVRDYEHRLFRVEYDGNRDAAKHLRLEPPEPTGTQYDRFGVDLVGHLTDQPPRLSLV
jgi:hypothetical protein